MELLRNVQTFVHCLDLGIAYTNYFNKIKSVECDDMPHLLLVSVVLLAKTRPVRANKMLIINNGPVHLVFFM